MVNSITSAVVGILTSVGTLLTPTTTGTGDMTTATEYVYLLALVAFASVFAVSRSIIKKLRRK